MADGVAIDEQQGPPYDGDKWEYAIVGIDVNDNLVNALNGAGAQGWLVATPLGEAPNPHRPGSKVIQFLAYRKRSAIIRVNDPSAAGILKVVK